MNVLLLAQGTEARAVRCPQTNTKGDGGKDQLLTHLWGKEVAVVNLSYRASAALSQAPTCIALEEGQCRVPFLDLMLFRPKCCSVGAQPIPKVLRRTTAGEISLHAAHLSYSLFFSLGLQRSPRRLGRKRAASPCLGQSSGQRGERLRGCWFGHGL